MVEQLLVVLSSARITIGAASPELGDFLDQLYTAYDSGQATREHRAAALGVLLTLQVMAPSDAVQECIDWLALE